MPARSNQIINSPFDRHCRPLYVRVTDPGKFRYSSVCNCRHNLLCEIEQNQSPKLNIASNHLHAHLLPDEVYNQNDQQDGSNAYSENTHGSVLRTFIGYGRELISFRSPTVPPPETAAVATPGS